MFFLVGMCLFILLLKEVYQNWVVVIQERNLRMGDGVFFYLCWFIVFNSNLEFNFFFQNIVFYVEC